MSGAFYQSKSDPRWINSQDKYRFQFNGKKNLLLFEELIGFVNPKHKKKFTAFLQYTLNYDNSVNGIASLKQVFIREPINLAFQNEMALGRI